MKTSHCVSIEKQRLHRFSVVVSLSFMLQNIQPGSWYSVLTDRPVISKIPALVYQKIDLSGTLSLENFHVSCCPSESGRVNKSRGQHRDLAFKEKILSSYNVRFQKGWANTKWLSLLVISFLHTAQLLKLPGISANLSSVKKAI